MPLARTSDRGLVLGIAANQLIGWGTLFTPFTLLIQPMERELGWSRAEISAAFTLGLLVSGLAAVHVGRFVDARGGRWPLGLGGLAGAALLGAWAMVSDLRVFYGLWFLMGLVHATALWSPAMAVVVALARQPMRVITGITFITGFTATVFIPLTEALILALGWRGALWALATLQCAAGLLALWQFAEARPPPPREGARRAPLAEALRRPAFWGLALLLSAHSFVGVGLAAHLVPLLRERGLDEASVIWLAALHGPFQVAARGLLFVAGPRAPLAAVGVFCVTLMPLAIAWLALAPPLFGWVLVFTLGWAVADGLLSIVRAGAPAEILGREGYGAVTGALALASAPMRAFAPVIVALAWQWSGGYDAAIWMLAAAGLLAALGFGVALLDRR
ncbi:MFS transporter [Rubritepida flocculans]|uniref:MFS transporter n=1 Tax=Rubritepida flocculans TaxID=182403 RepID=UPI0003F5FF32|nr:MFS transporter [Rubritepida flocculans]